MEIYFSPGILITNLYCLYKVLRFEIEELKEKERLLQVELNEVKSDNKSLTAQLDSERKKAHPD